MKLIFVTHNPHKKTEIEAILPSHVQIRSLNEIGCHDEIPETALTLEGNAKIKANYVFQNYKLPCFADDTGLEVNALKGAPGVFSARYAGEPKNDLKNIEKLLQDLEGKEDRSAQFTTVIVLRTPLDTHCFKGVIKGVIAASPTGTNGFGYDPVFIPEGYDKTFAELPLTEKNKISHRARAFAKLVRYLAKVSDLE